MKYLYLDTETGGINPRYDALLTIGLVAHDDEKGILDTAHILVQPDNRVVTPEALAVNHIILNDHLVNAMSRDMAANTIKLFINKNFGWGFPNKPFVVGHNIAFDRSFVDPLFEDEKYPPYSYRNLDTMGIALFLYDMGIFPSAKNLKLDYLIEYYGVHINAVDRHTALGDALATRLVHLAMRNDLRKHMIPTN